jgi:hypothetical protein
MINKKVLLALSSILGSSAIASGAVVDFKTDLNTDDNNLKSIDVRDLNKNRSKEFTLKVNFNNVEDSIACFHASHSSHSSHASHSSHSSSSFV